VNLIEEAEKQIALVTAINSDDSLMEHEIRYRKSVETVGYLLSMEFKDGSESARKRLSDRLDIARVIAVQVVLKVGEVEDYPHGIQQRLNERMEIYKTRGEVEFHVALEAAGYVVGSYDSDSELDGDEDPGEVIASEEEGETEKS